MRKGDYVFVTSGMMHAVGRVECGAGVMIQAPSPSYVTLDLCSMGVHLPQIYSRRECKPIEVVKLAEHGLCLTCKGWGLTSMYDSVESVDVVLEGRHGDVCPDCHGSGRKGVQMDVVRSSSGAQGTVTVADDATDGVTCKVCRAIYGDA